MSSLTAGAEDRKALYGRLTRRNRVVGLLRFAVPALGVLLVVAVAMQVQVSGIGQEYGISKITVTPNEVVVATPRYTGILPDGTRYEVEAISASAATDGSGLIDLTDAIVSLTPASGAKMQIQADKAQMDTGNQRFLVAGEALVENQGGTRGTATGLILDWKQLVYSAAGGVEFDYGNGTTLLAESMRFDPTKNVWTFSRATMTLPSAPAPEAAAAPAGGA